MIYMIEGVSCFLLIILLVFSFCHAMLQWYALKTTPAFYHLIDKAYKPFITIQVPVYNEKFVIENMINHLSKMNYAKHLFEIHILDDSTDETSNTIEQLVLKWQAKGVNICQVKRTNRVGYKAGALNNALPLAQGELILILDADFLPNPDFLNLMVPYFVDTKIGMVQANWDYINKNKSLLTLYQAFALNIHFYVEQCGRQNLQSFINFNGTAGIWRKSCIVEAGGWQNDSLTEDLDISIRAQLKNWKFLFLNHIRVPSLLPETVFDFKLQQHRWNKGGAQISKKLFLNWLAYPTTLFKKIIGTAHLMASSIYVIIFCYLLLSSLLVIFQLNQPSPWLYLLNAFYGFTTVFIFTGIAISYYKQNNSIHFFYHLFQLFVFIIFSLGCLVGNVKAVLEGWLGISSPFVRTPKFIKQSTVKDNVYIKSYSSNLLWIGFLEVLLIIYFSLVVNLSLQHHYYSFIGFHSIFLFSLIVIKFMEFFQVCTRFKNYLS